jgi:hypothetical protein
MSREKSGLQAVACALFENERAQLWLADRADPYAYPLALKPLLDRPRRVGHRAERELALRNTLSRPV